MRHGSNPNAEPPHQHQRYTKRKQTINGHTANSRHNSQSNCRGDGDGPGRAPTTGSWRQQGDRVSDSQNGAPSSQQAWKSQQQRQHRSSTGRHQSEVSTGSQGDLDYYSDPFDLDEPFSDSEGEDGPRASKVPSRPKLNLPLPRGRIRTLSGTVPPVGYSPVFGGPTMCLQCMEFFDLPDQTKEYVEHLLGKHKIVITDITLIVDLKRYIEHWRHRLNKQSVDTIFPKVVPKEGEELHGKVDEYFLISEKVSEDRQLRERLALRRLEEVLQCQQREREDTFFSQPCLFCRYTARGNRSKLIHHLYMIHHLNLGSPDNLVFVAEYIDTLREKFNRNECIYCEKIYPDRMALMEHMRKRGHREVNPKNHYYDKFYIINYLELGKRWLDVLAEDFEDATPHFVDSDEEEEEESWNEWNQDTNEEQELLTVCLFCDQAEEDIDGMFKHMNEEHTFDLLDMIKSEKLTFYDRVKFVNYVRKMNYKCKCFVCGMDDLHSFVALRKHMQIHKDKLSQAIMKKRDEWEHEEYLVPIFENDHLLWMLQSHLQQLKIEGVNAHDPADDLQMDRTPKKLDEPEDAHDDALTPTEEHPVPQRKPSKSSTGGHRKHRSSVSERMDRKKSLAEPESEDEDTAGWSKVVIPEDMPDLKDSSLKDDKELLDSLQ